MSTPVITPSADPQVQTTPTPAGMPPPVPVQPRDDAGRFAPVPQAAPASTPTPAPVATPAVPVATPTPTPAAPYTLNDLGNGQFEVKFSDLPETYKGTQAELLPKIAEALYNTKKWAQTQRQTPPAPAPVPTPTPAPANSRFADSVEEQAAGQLLDLIAKKAGYDKGDDLLQALSHTTSTADDYQSNQLAIGFQAQQPDFNGTPENIDKLSQTIGMFVGSDQAWAQMAPAQQLNAMRAAHAFNLQNKIYEPRPATPATATPTVLPPPPVPTGKAPQDAFSGVPPELVPTVNDTQAQILEKIGKLKAMGYSQ